MRGLTYRNVLRLYDLSPRAPGAIRAEKIFAKVQEMVGGVRIEDTLVVRPSTPELLTLTAKELVEV